MSRLRFTKSPNPCATKPPAHDNPVRWVVEGYDPEGPDIQWSSGDHAVVVAEPVGPSSRHEAIVTATGLGMTQITAAQGEHRASSYVWVGDLFAYILSEQLRHAPSQFWSRLDQRPNGCPLPEQMAGYGVAWVQPANGEPPYMLINVEDLNTVRGPDLDATYFFSAHRARGERHERPGPLPPETTSYAYAPDGSLWTVPFERWIESANTPEAIPSYEKMAARHAAMGWVPPSGFPTAREEALPAVTKVIAAVTCYVLSAAEFPLADEQGTTFYKIIKQP